MLVLRFGFLAVLIVGTLAVLKAQPGPEAEAATLEITAAERARGLTFAPGSPPPTASGSSPPSPRRGRRRRA